MKKNMLTSKSGKALLVITSTLLSSSICSAVRWTSGEDARLTQLVQEQQNKGWALNWGVITAEMPGKTRDQCYARWTQHLNSDINKDSWSQAEDAELIRLVQLHGTKNWAKCARLMGNGRTNRQCRTRYQTLMCPNTQAPRRQALLVGLPPPPPRQTRSRRPTPRQQIRLENPPLPQQAFQSAPLAATSIPLSPPPPQQLPQDDLFDTGSFAREFRDEELLDRDRPHRDPFDVEFREGDSFDRKLFHRGPSARERLYDPFEGL